MANYIIGIDLGTTNIAVAYLDTRDDDSKPEIFKIPQVTSRGEYAELESLPSFLYLPPAQESESGAFDLPWSTGRDFCIGAFARKNAASNPGRVIASAKSWLCAANVDRLAPILPWGHEESDRKLSPLDVSRRFLEHIRDAWNHKMSESTADRFEDQKIILTVPASFDNVARDLTVQAAQAAGLTVTLLEEPQAAFYAWLQDNQDSWRDKVVAGDTILVCDIGGGTTDFSLIKVSDEDGTLDLRRIAVGNHILLGGDNLDLTLAYIVGAKLQRERNIKLDNYQISGLTHACREVKELLFANPEQPPQNITVLGRGSSVIGGTITTTLSFDELAETVLDGFFPNCDLSDEPTHQARAGLREFGLNYEADPAVTRHLATFLTNHSGDDAVDPRSIPKVILFNGGVTKSQILRDKIMAVMASWQSGTDQLTAIEEAHPDLAVAIGACWYGFVSLGEGIRIKAGSARSYYVGIESTMPAVPGFTPPVDGLCVVPFGMEEGAELDIPYSGLGLIVGETTEFRLFTSNTRQSDEPGTLLADVLNEDTAELPSLSTKLSIDESKTSPGSLLSVRLRAVLTEIGTLQLWCLEESGDGKWKLEYEIRASE